MYIGIITFSESVLKIRISAIKTYPLKKTRMGETESLNQCG